MFASGGLLLLLDQWSKATFALRGTDRRVPWLPALRIRRVNAVKPLYCSAFGRAFMAVAWLAALAGATLFQQHGGWFHSPIERAGIGVALGGAAGNLLDVLRRHYVIDFIDVRWWPVFNLADVAIVGGLVAAFFTRLTGL
jgi:lipoprotein signal peptidase